MEGQSAGRRPSRKKAELAHIGKVPSFVSHLWTMLHDPRWKHIVHFSDDGSSFLIEDEDALAQQVLPQYFNTSSVASFGRQLNFYNFKRVMDEIPDDEMATVLLERMNGERKKKDAVEYRHKFFHRDQPAWLTKVIRKTNHRAIRQLVEARAGGDGTGRADAPDGEDGGDDDALEQDVSMSEYFESSMAEAGPNTWRGAAGAEAAEAAGQPVRRSGTPVSTGMLQSAGLQLVGATQTTLRLDGARRSTRGIKPRHFDDEDDGAASRATGRGRDVPAIAPGKRPRPPPKIKSESLLDVLQGDEDAPLSPSIIEATAHFPTPARSDRRSRRSATGRAVGSSDSVGEASGRRSRRRSSHESDGAWDEGGYDLPDMETSSRRQLADETDADAMEVVRPSRRRRGAGGDEQRPSLNIAEGAYLAPEAAYSPALEEAALSLCMTRRASMSSSLLESLSSNASGADSLPASRNYVPPMAGSSSGTGSPPKSMDEGAAAALGLASLTIPPPVPGELRALASSRVCRNDACNACEACACAAAAPPGGSMHAQPSTAAAPGGFAEILDFLSPLHAVANPKRRQIAAAPLQASTGGAEPPTAAPPLPEVQFHVSSLQSPWGSSAGANPLFTPLGGATSSGLTAPPALQTPSSSMTTSSVAGPAQGTVALVSLPSHMVAPGGIVYMLDDHGGLVPFEIASLSGNHGAAASPTEAGGATVPPTTSSAWLPASTTALAHDIHVSPAPLAPTGDGSSSAAAGATRSLTVDTTVVTSAAPAPQHLGIFSLHGPPSLSTSLLHPASPPNQGPVGQPSFQNLGSASLSEMLTPALRSFLASFASPSAAAREGAASTTSHGSELYRAAIRNANAQSTRSGSTEGPHALSASHAPRMPQAAMLLSPLNVRLTPHVLSRPSAVSSHDTPTMPSTSTTVAQDSAALQPSSPPSGAAAIRDAQTLLSVSTAGASLASLLSPSMNVSAAPMERLPGDGNSPSTGASSLPVPDQGDIRRVRSTDRRPPPKGAIDVRAGRRPDVGSKSAFQQFISPRGRWQSPLGRQASFPRAAPVLSVEQAAQGARQPAPSSF